MTPLHKWYEALKKDPKATEAGIRWFTPEETTAKQAELTRGYESPELRERLHLPEEAFTTARAQVARFVPVGEGPPTSDRSGTKHRGLLLLDKKATATDELKVALSPLHPPLFWLGGGQTAASLKDVFTAYFPNFSPSEEKLEKTVRAFIGTGAVNKIDLIQLHHRYKASPFLDGLAWGSAHEREPVTTAILPRGLAGEDLARRFREQSPKGRHWYAFRTLFSKAVLRAEAHVKVAGKVNIFVAQVRYRPAKQAAQLKDINQKLGTHYPEDFPVDLAGALLGLPFELPERIRAGFQKQPPVPNLNFMLLCLDCLAADNTAADKELRPFAAHTDNSVRRTVANLALRRDLKPLIAEMAGRETQAGLKKRLSEAAQRLK